MKVAVVTGGTGFIGWHLCERLRAEGWTVRAVVRAKSRNQLPVGIERFEGELQEDTLTPVCESAEVLYHLAGVTRARSLEAFCRVNEECARQAALAAAATGTRLVLVSSQAAAGPGTLEMPRFEDDPPAPVSIYGRSKLAGERAVLAVPGIEGTIIRPPGVYGPRDEDFLLLFRLASHGFSPVLGSPSTAYTLVHVIDLVVGMIELANSPAAIGETFFLGHPEPVTQAEIVDALQHAVGRQVRRLPLPRPLLWALAQAGQLGALWGHPGLMNPSRYRELTAPGFVCSVEKVSRTIGFKAATNLFEGFAATARWYQSEGLL